MNDFTIGLKSTFQAFRLTVYFSSLFYSFQQKRHCVLVDSGSGLLSQDKQIMNFP